MIANSATVTEDSGLSAFTWCPFQCAVLSIYRKEFQSEWHATDPYSIRNGWTVGNKDQKHEKSHL